MNIESNPFGRKETEGNFEQSANFGAGVLRDSKEPVNLGSKPTMNFGGVAKPKLKSILSNDIPEHKPFVSVPKNTKPMMGSLKRLESKPSYNIIMNKTPVEEKRHFDLPKWDREVTEKDKTKIVTSNGMEEEELEDENSIKDGSYYVGPKKSDVSPREDFSEMEVQKETLNSNSTRDRAAAFALKGKQFTAPSYIPSEANRP